MHENFVLICTAIQVHPFSWLEGCPKKPGTLAFPTIGTTKLGVLVY